MAIKAKSRGFLFDEVKIDAPKRSAFDLSFENKLSLNFGELVPVLCKEVLPNDDIELNSSIFCRFAPLLAPMMHKVDVMTYNFFVPNRIIWKDWESFISPGNGNVVMSNQPSFVPPKMPSLSLSQCLMSGYTDKGDEKKVARLCDYLGLPFNPDSKPGDFSNQQVSELPFRAYNKIYNDYFRDQNLTAPYYDGVSETSFSPASGNMEIKAVSSAFQLRRPKFKILNKCWEKDIFTSALTDPQRGASVMLPLGDSAPIELKEGESQSFTAGVSGGTIIVRTPGASAQSSATWSPSSGSETATLVYTKDGSTANATVTNATATIGVHNLATKMQVDLSKASSITIESLRAAYSLQEWLEKAARTGARYCESMLAHFGQSIEDSRLDRPEFLGGSRNPVNISDVMQTSSTNESTSQPLGDYAGKAISTGSDFTKYHVPEHGWIMTLICVIPRTAYYQGLPKQFQRFDYLDYAWPEFAHLGEQAILNKELYCQGSSQKDADEIFGYTPRYAEYKYNPDEVHGEFKTSLKFWHMARSFDSTPKLNASFVECQPSYDPFAVLQTGTDHVYCDIWHDFKAIRCLPMFGTPHF
nr:major head protein [Microvirus sp.]